MTSLSGLCHAYLAQQPLVRARIAAASTTTRAKPAQPEDVLAALSVLQPLATLIHALQNERGATSGWVASHGKHELFRALTETARAATDAAAIVVKASPALVAALENVRAAANEVVQSEMSAVELAHRLYVCFFDFDNLLTLLQTNLSSGLICPATATFASFSQLKDAVGVMRAFVAVGLVLPEVAEGELSECFRGALVVCFHRQAACMNAIRASAPRKLIALVGGGFELPPIMLEVKQQLEDNFSLESVRARVVDTEEWWKISTAHIDTLQSLQEALLQALEQTACRGHMRTSPRRPPRLTASSPIIEAHETPVAFAGDAYDADGMAHLGQHGLQQGLQCDLQQVGLQQGHLLFRRSSSSASISSIGSNDSYGNLFMQRGSNAQWGTFAEAAAVVAAAAEVEAEAAAVMEAAGPEAEGPEGAAGETHAQLPMMVSSPDLNGLSSSGRSSHGDAKGPAGRSEENGAAAATRDRETLVRAAAARLVLGASVNCACSLSDLRRGIEEMSDAQLKHVVLDLLAADSPPSPSELSSRRPSSIPSSSPESPVKRESTKGVDSLATRGDSSGDSPTKGGSVHGKDCQESSARGTAPHSPHLTAPPGLHKGNGLAWRRTPSSNLLSPSRTDARAEPLGAESTVAEAPVAGGATTEVGAGLGAGGFGCAFAPASPLWRSRTARGSKEEESQGAEGVDGNWRIGLNEVSFQRKIGAGAAGTTYAATWNGAQVAVKVAGCNGSSVEGWRAEVHALTKLRHPHIVQYLGCVISPPTYCLVLEFCDAGDLYRALRMRTPPTLLLRVAKAVAAGMAYLHKRQIMHRDLKSSNVLLDTAGGVKLTDFGVAVQVDGATGFGSPTNEFELSCSPLTAQTGTYRWMAPEVARNEGYTKSADVFSYGMLLFELLTHQVPFADRPPLQAAVAIGIQDLRPQLPVATPKPLADLIAGCWSRRPIARPKFVGVLQALSDAAAQMSLAEMTWVDEPYGHPVYPLASEGGNGADGSCPNGNARSTGAILLERSLPPATPEMKLSVAGT